MHQNRKTSIHTMTEMLIIVAYLQVKVKAAFCNYYGGASASKEKQQSIGVKKENKIDFFLNLLILIRNGS